MNPVGVIGVGVIGGGFVEELRDAERDVLAFDLDQDRMDWAVEQGAEAASSPADVGDRAECVILALPGTPEVAETLLGTGRVLAGDTPQLVIDASTTLPETSIRCQEACEEAGVSFVEAPITGGSPRTGMHMMVGGTTEDSDTATQVLDILCAGHRRIGKVGDAMIFKLGLQLRYAGHHAIDAEVISFLRDNGVDPAPLVDFLEFDVFDRYFTEDYHQDISGLGGFAIWKKDIGYAASVAHEENTALPLTTVVHEAYKSAGKRLKPDERHAAALIRYWEALNDQG